MHLQELTQRMNEFVQAKDWYAPDSPRLQTPRNLAISLAIEAAEVLEHFQWGEHTPDPAELSSELADVALYLLQLAHVSQIDLEGAILSKLELNMGRSWDEKE